MRGKRIETTRERALERLRGLLAFEARQHYTGYHLHYPNGGHDPEAMYPGHVAVDPALVKAGYEMQCDCVGLAMWFLKCDRVQAAPWTLYFDKKLGYGHVNCNTMIKDALGPKVLFEDATKTKDGPRAGDLVVFGGIGLVGSGHVGVLTGNGKVAHCSPRNQKTLGHAIAETGPEIFYSRRGWPVRLGGTMWLRYRWFKGEQVN